MGLSSRITSLRARNSRCAQWRWRIRSFNLLRAKRTWQALVLCAIALGFIVNMVFVIVSRTAMVTMPIMLARIRAAAPEMADKPDRLRRAGCPGRVGLGGHIAAGCSGRRKPSSGTIGSTSRTMFRLRFGIRLEFWKKSLGFIAEAPLIGHGTGGGLRIIREGGHHGKYRQRYPSGDRKSPQPNA